MATATAPTRVQPGLDFSRDYVFTSFPSVVHLQQSGQIDKTRCGKPVRYYVKPGDQRSWLLCHECQKDLEREEANNAHAA